VVSLNLLTVALVLLGMALPQAAPAPSASPSSQTTPQSPPVYNDDEGYAVLSALLAGDPARPTKGTTLIQATTSGWNCSKAEEATPPDFREALQNFAAVNKNGWTLQEKLTLDHPYKLLSAADLQGGITRYRQSHPGASGFTSVSAVGFNREKTAALVFMSYHCGPLCGEGELVAFRKTDGKWTKLPRSPAQCGWIS
jgi:hypothetical protein